MPAADPLSGWSLRRLVPLLCFLFGAFAGCQEKPPEPALVAMPPTTEVVKIGVIGPLTGPSEGYGTSQLNGVRLAAEEINAQEQETGYRIDLVVVDDRSNMSTVAEQVVALVHDDEVNAIIGAINSGVTHVVEMVAAKTQVPMITTTSTDPSITRTGTYWAFRCLADDVLQAGALADRVFRLDRHTKVALMREDNRYGKMGGKELARLAVEVGCPLVLDLFFKGAEERFAAEVASLRASGAEALVIWSLYGPAARLVSAIRAAGIDLPIYGADGMVHPEFTRLAGPAAEGVIVTFPFDPQRDDPLTHSFTARFQARFGSPPDSFAAHSYDALMILWAAILRGRCTDRACLKDNLLLTKLHPGVTGPITLDRQGNDTRTVDLARVVNGAFVKL